MTGVKSTSEVLCTLIYCHVPSYRCLC